VNEHYRKFALPTAADLLTGERVYTTGADWGHHHLFQGPTGFGKTTAARHAMLAARICRVPLWVSLPLNDPETRNFIRLLFADEPHLVQTVTLAPGQSQLTVDPIGTLLKLYDDDPVSIAFQHAVGLGAASGGQGYGPDQWAKMSTVPQLAAMLLAFKNGGKLRTYAQYLQCLREAFEENHSLLKNAQVAYADALTLSKAWVFQPTPGMGVLDVFRWLDEAGCVVIEGDVGLYPMVAQALHRLATTMLFAAHAKAAEKAGRPVDAVAVFDESQNTFATDAFFPYVEAARRNGLGIVFLLHTGEQMRGKVRNPYEVYSRICNTRGFFCPSSDVETKRLIQEASGTVQEPEFSHSTGVSRHG
jgi:hypothetical protein